MYIQVNRLRGQRGEIYIEPMDLKQEQVLCHSRKTQTQARTKLELLSQQPVSAATFLLSEAA